MTGVLLVACNPRTAEDWFIFRCQGDAHSLVWADKHLEFLNNGKKGAQFEMVLGKRRMSITILTNTDWLPVYIDSV
jgi:hypothetical protein